MLTVRQEVSSMLTVSQEMSCTDGESRGELSAELDLETAGRENGHRGWIAVFVPPPCYRSST